jgi:transposase-like protein
MALGRRTRGARIPDELRAEVIRYATERRRNGDGVRRIARALGVAAESVRRWTTPSTKGRTRALVPIVVRADDDAPAGTLTLTAPDGYRVDGLTVASAAALLRALA